MKVEAEKKQKIEGYAREHYKAQDQTHGIEHLERTLKLAEHIAEKEDADKEIVRFGAMLHQIHDAEEVKEFLEKIEVKQEKAEKIVHCVYCSDIENIEEAETIEAKVVYDADKLQVVGAFGIIREIACDTGERGKTFREAVQHTREIEPKCFETIQTETGKKIAESHHDLLEEFWQKFDEMDKAEVTDE
jgi:uncharacterized protein